MTQQLLAFLTGQYNFPLIKINPSLDSIKVFLLFHSLTFFTCHCCSLLYNDSFPASHTLARLP
jgi:hypothetical protein